MGPGLEGSSQLFFLFFALVHNSTYRMTGEFLRAPLRASCVKSVEVVNDPDILRGLCNLISPLPPRTTHHLRGGAYSFIQVTSIFLGWNLSLHNESAKFIGNFYIIFTNSAHNILRDAKRK